MGDDMKRLGRRTGALAALALALLAPASKADAATACGTIITNVATATMWSGSPDYVAYEVSYNASATIIVLCPPVVALRKFANTDYGSFQQAPSGGTVTFMICVENQTVTSVWGMTITDRLPVNVTVANAFFSQYNMTGVPVPPAPTAAYSADNLTWTNGSAAAGQGAPFYLRWTIEKIGPLMSACVSWTARIL